MSLCRISRRNGAWMAVAILLMLSLAGSAFAATRALPDSTPGIVASAKNLGPANTSTTTRLTIWLQLRYRATLDQLAQQIYTKGSPNYGKFLTREEFKSRFAPTDDAVAAVHEFAKAHNLEVISTSKSNMGVTVQGAIGDVQNAFHVQINQYQRDGLTFRAPANAPSIDGPAAPFVASVGGLHDLKASPHAVRAINPETGKPMPGIPLAQAKAKAQAAPKSSSYSGIFEDQCWPGVETHAFTTNNKLPAAVYSGNKYGAEPGLGPPDVGPCGYEPYPVWNAYGMLPLFAAGATGAGQTVVIVDAFDWPTLQADAATFSSFYGVPPINLTILQPQGPPAYNAGWSQEMSLDIQWSHTMAPFADIVLVEAIDNLDVSLDNAVLYAIEAGLGNVISNSYGYPEALVDSATLDAENAIFEFGALVGVSVNFSSGDDGDFTLAYGVKSVTTGADSPWATGVGGTSLFLNPDLSMKFQTGWGNTETRIAAASPNPPLVPPLSLGFIYGAGGGTSGYFAKPSFQASLPGSKRQVPDVGFLADPYTGVAIVWNDGSGQALLTIGGTSLACPMFSGVWAIVNQAAGGGPVGQAAPYMYNLPAGSVYDVTNLTSPTNVAGSIFTGGAPIYESPAALVAPLFGNTKFVSGFYHGSSTRWYVLSFGDDTSLRTGPGWDNVTGVGTPNGIPFVLGVLSQLK